MAKPNSYKDPYWSNLSKQTEKKLELPEGLLESIVIYGERSNADQVSEAGAKTPFQIIPQTRKLIIDKYGIDPYLSDENAAEAAGLLLKESLKRNGGDITQAVGEYHGGTDRKNWGPRTVAYQARVSDGLEAAKVDRISAEFGDWLKNKDKQAETQTVKTNEPNKVDQAALEFGDWLKNKSKEQQEEPSMWAKAKDVVTGELRQTPESQSLPEWVTMPELNDIASVAGWKTAIGTLMSSPEETAQIIKANSPNSQVRQDEKGNFIIKSGKDGKDYVIPPGLSMGDVPRILAGIAAFTPAGRMTSAGVEGIAGGVLGSGLTQGAVEASQSATGGEFNPETVSSAALIGGAIPAATQAMPTIIQGVKSAAQPAQQVINKIVGNAPKEIAGESGSVGSAAVPKVLQQKALGESLPVPITNQTKGQLTNDLDQQAFEKSIAKQTAGRDLLNTFEEHNSIISKNFDTMIESKGVDIESSLRQTGLKVDSAIKKEIEKAKTQINHEYKMAEKSVEGQQPVKTDSFVNLLNSLKSSEGNSGVIKSAKDELIRLGGATKVEGELVPSTLTIPDLYKIRTLINQNTKFEGPDLNFAPILKKEIDKIMSENGGELYKKANATYAKYAAKFKSRAVIKNLVRYKPGTNDRKVAFEDVFNHSILNGSRDDVLHLRNVLKGSTGGSHGLEAWHELQAQTIAHIKNRAFKNEGRNTRGEAIVSSKGLNEAIKNLDNDGKLDIIFNKKEAEDLRTLGQLSRSLFNAPPGAINASETSTIILRALDSGLFGLIKLPIPILKSSLQYIKDRKLRTKVLEALNYHKQVK